MLYAARLQEAGHQVTVLARNSRLADVSLYAGDWASVLDAANSRARQVLAGWRGSVVSDAEPIVPKARQRRVREERQGGLSQLDHVGPRERGELTVSD
jgi:hypothetical protein